MKHPFADRIKEGMTRSGLSLRELCRRAEIDPSLLSKVLTGKRPPPGEERVLRRLAEVLSLPPEELVVSAGYIPSEWRGLNDSPELLRTVSAVITSGRKAPLAVKAPRPPFGHPLPLGGEGRGLGEELL